LPNLPGPTPDQTKQIAGLLRAGNYLEAAGYAAGADPHLVKHWLEHGSKTQTGAMRAFYTEVTRAMADAEGRLVAIVATEAKGTWQAAAWLLERRYPDRWARPSQRGESPLGKEQLPATDPMSELDELRARRSVGSA
jgi:hypothetical protein